MSCRTAASAGPRSRCRLPWRWWRTRGVLDEPEAEEQDDKQPNALLQRAVHACSLVRGKECARRDARTTPLSTKIALRCARRRALGAGCRTGHHRRMATGTSAPRPSHVDGGELPALGLRRRERRRARSHGPRRARHHRLLEELAGRRRRPARRLELFAPDLRGRGRLRDLPGRRGSAATPRTSAGSPSSSTPMAPASWCSPATRWGPTSRCSLSTPDPSFLVGWCWSTAAYPCQCRRGWTPTRCSLPPSARR